MAYKSGVSGRLFVKCVNNLRNNNCLDFRKLKDDTNMLILQVVLHVPSMTCEHGIK